MNAVRREAPWFVALGALVLGQLVLLELGLPRSALFVLSLAIAICAFRIGVHSERLRR